MKDIIIVGAGGFGREAYYLLKRINSIKPTWNIKGFIDDNSHALDGLKCDCPIIGTISHWIPNNNEFLAMGISSPQTKEKVVKLLKSRGGRFATLISPHVPIDDYTNIGEGCIITGISIGDNVTIGNFVHVAGSMIGQDVEIGDYTTSTGFVNITPSKIGKRVFIGSHSVILNGVKVGDDAFICAGSIVLRNVKAGTKVIGYPAKQIDI